MILLAVLPLIVLIVAVLLVRMVRGFREVSELRMRQSPLMVPTSHRKPSDEYHDHTWLPLCTRIADAAIARLGRPLNERERRTIWRTRAALTLEVVLKEIEAATSAESVASLHASLPPGMDRPDPTEWSGIGGGIEHSRG